MERSKTRFFVKLMGWVQFNKKTSELCWVVHLVCGLSNITLILSKNGSKFFSVKVKILSYHKINMWMFLRNDVIVDKWNV